MSYVPSGNVTFNALYKIIKWLVAWIVLIIYYLKTGNFAEYDIWNAIGLSLPFYIAMYRVFSITLTN